MTGGIITRTLFCNFVRNSAVTGKLILQDSFRAEVDYLLSGFHFSSAISSRSTTVTCGAFLLVNDQPILDFSNSTGLRVFASQCLVRSNSGGVDRWAHRSEWIDIPDGFMLRSGQTIGLYAFASNLNTQSTLASIALALIRADQVAA